MREAISAKESLLNAVENKPLKKWRDENGINYTDIPENRASDELHIKHAGEASIDEMAQYFIAQSKASTLGQAIHPDGPEDKARRELIGAGLKPSQREGSGKDTVIMTKVPTAAIDDVTNFYMELQGNWRRSESRVNKSKNSWATKDSEMKICLTNEYNSKMCEFEKKTSRIKGEWEKYKLEKTRRIGKLKIRILCALRSNAYR